MNAFFINCELAFWQDVARTMERDHGWSVRYWTGTRAIEDQVRTRFPEAVFHRFHDAVKSIPPQGFDPSRTPDEPLLEKLALCQANAFKMMDRYGVIGSFTPQEQTRLYLRLVAYWLGVIETLAPDVVVFPTAPHMVYDYVLFELCRVLGVRTVMFERTSVPGLVYPVASYREGSRKLRDLCRQGVENDGSVSPAVQEYLDGIRDREGRTPAHVKHKNKHMTDTLGLVKKAWLLYTKGVPESYDKVPGRPFEYRTMTPLENLRKTVDGRRTRRRLAAYYDRLAGPVDTSRPYVYVGLHCQPERSSSPCGGFYAHQELMVGLLAQNLPDGWRVYVKEHPSQFKRFQRAERAKTLNFYEDMAAMDNVDLVPLSQDSFELMDKARGVATISGSVGFEAVARGIPALVFGNAWYAGCEGAFDVRDEISLRDALAKIADGYAVDRDRLLRYLHCVERVGVRGYIDGIYEKITGIDPAENAASIASAIAGLTEEVQP